MTFVALLRAINVGGRSVPMADLKALASSLGWSNLRTYIQSGNLLFEADGQESELARILETALQSRYPFPIPVLVLSADRWRQTAADRPFDGWSDPKQLSVTLLESAPEPGRWQALEPWVDGDAAIELIDNRVWVKTPSGYGETKFHNTWLEKKLGVRATTRNRATIDAIVAML